MNKRAIAETLSDLMGWTIFILILLILTFLFTLIHDKNAMTLDTITLHTNNDLTFLNILRTPLNNTNQISDLISLSILTNKENNQELKNILNRSLNIMYSQPDKICWKLRFYDQEKLRLLASVDGKIKNGEPLLEEQGYIPLHNNEKKKIKLVVQECD